MAIKVGNKVEMTSYPQIHGTVTWIEPPEIVVGCRVAHIACNGHTYRLDETSLTVLNG